MLVNYLGVFTVYLKWLSYGSLEKLMVIFKTYKKEVVVDIFKGAWRSGSVMAFGAIGRGSK